MDKFHFAVHMDDPGDIESWTNKKLSEWLGKYPGARKSGSRNALLNRVQHIIDHGPP